MDGYRQKWKKMGLALLVCGSLVAGGCEGTDTRETMDDTVEEVSGKKNLQRYDRMKEDLNDIEQRQAEKYRQLDHEAKE